MSLLWKQSPEIRCRALPRSALPRGGVGGFAVAIVMGETLGTTGGTSTGPLSGIPLLNPLASRAWNEPAQAKSIGQALEFIRFSKDGTVTFGASGADASGEDEFAGFGLRRIETPLDCRGPGDAANTDRAAQVLEAIFSSISGTHRGVLAGLEGQARGLVNVGKEGSSRSQTTLPANFGSRWTITGQGLIGTGTQAGTPGNVRIKFGEGLYGAVLTHGKPPTLVKTISGVDYALSSLKGASDVDLRGGTRELRFWQVGGRGIIGWGGRFWWWAEYGSASGAAQNDRRDLIPVAWPMGAATVDAIGCRVRVNLASIEDDTLASEADRQIVFDIGPTNYTGQGASATGQASGWLKHGTARVAMQDNGARGTVTLTINGAPDKRNGPIVNKVSGLFPDSPYNAGSTAFLDVSAAVRSASLSMAYPPIQAGANMSVTLNRKHLDRIGAAEGLNWGDWIQQFGVLTWEARWNYGDGVAQPWTPFFKGIVAKPDVGTGAANEQHMTLTCFDPVYLLQDPAGMVRGQYPPLDVLWMQKLRQSNSQTSVGSGPYNPYNPPAVGGLPQNQGTLGYGGDDAIRDILWLFRGPEAARLYVDIGTSFPLLGSDSDPFGYCRAEQVASGDTQAPGVNGWCLPAPYNSDALSWINDICQKINALFFYGWVPGDDYLDWPRPILTTPPRLFAGRATHTVADSIYEVAVNGAITTLGQYVNKVLQSIEKESRPEAAINTVEATASGFFGDSLDGSGLPPRRAAGSIGDESPNGASHSYERTLMRDVGSLGALPGGVEVYVLQLISDLKGTVQAWPTLQMDGRCNSSAHNESPIVPGDKVQLKFVGGVESDTGLGINNYTFRVGSISHNWSLGESVKTFTSAVQLRPLSGEGL